MRIFEKNLPENVSPTMVKNVFEQLRANGYSEGQIISLSKELGKMADARSSRADGIAGLGTMSFEMDLSGMAWL